MGGIWWRRARCGAYEPTEDLAALPLQAHADLAACFVGRGHAIEFGYKNTGQADLWSGCRSRNGLRRADAAARRAMAPR